MTKALVLLALLLQSGVGNFILDDEDQFILGGGSGEAPIPTDQNELGPGPLFISHSITTCSALTGSYVSKAQVSYYVRQIIIQNNCNATISITKDPSSEGMQLLAGRDVVFDMTDTERVESPARSTIYLKHAGAAPTSGEVHVTVIN